MCGLYLVIYFVLGIYLTVCLFLFQKWGGREALKEKMPVYVEKMLEKYDLMKEYEQMVDHVVEAGVGSKSNRWNIEKLKVCKLFHRP